MRATRVLGYVLVVLVLGAWEAAARVGAINPAFLPPPSAVATAWLGYAASGDLATNLIATLSSWAQGFAIAAVLGVVLGVLMGLFPVVRAMLRLGFWALELSSGRKIYGAYWHDRFGIEHGPSAIQLSPTDAQRLFTWASPALPNGFHGFAPRAVKDGVTYVVLRK